MMKSLEMLFVPLFFVLAPAGALLIERWDMASALLLEQTNTNSDQANATYDGRFTPSQLLELRGPLIPADAIKAGRECILLMDVAYMLEGQTATFPETMQFLENLTNITKANGPSG